MTAPHECTHTPKCPCASVAEWAHSEACRQANEKMTLRTERDKARELANELDDLRRDEIARCVAAETRVATLEMALDNAARSLEHIAQRQRTKDESFEEAYYEVRAYANSRAGVARHVLSDAPDVSKTCLCGQTTSAPNKNGIWVWPKGHAGYWAEGCCRKPAPTASGKTALAAASLLSAMTVSATTSDPNRNEPPDEEKK